MLESTHMEVTGGMQNKSIALETMQLKEKHWGVSCLGTDLWVAFFFRDPTVQNGRQKFNGNIKLGER